MTDTEYIQSIRSMSIYDLMKEILANPNYLTDPYYRLFGAAILLRAAQLMSQAT